MRKLYRMVLVAVAAALAVPPAWAGDQPPAAVDASMLVPIDPVMVTIITNSRAVGALTVGLILQVRNPLERGAVAVQRPRLVDAYRQTLSDLAARRLDIRRPLDVAMLDRYLQRVTDKALGEGRATVLIQSAVITTNG